MLSTVLNVFKIAELRNKVLFTLAMLAVYRVGFWIPLPGINQEQLASFFKGQQTGSAIQKAADFMSIFSGGAFSHSTIFGLGIMPYISAGIIFQLVGSIPGSRLKKLQEEGPTGRQKVIEWTRYTTVGLCILQALTYLGVSQKQGIIYPELMHSPLWWVMAVTALTAGTVFLMWLGEQIDRYGIGNGVSMIIMAGIVARMPDAIRAAQKNFEPGADGKMGWMGVIVLCVGFVGVIAGAVLMTVAQRRIPIQQAKHTKGKRVFGGQRSYLPLRINHGGVMPIVFASSLMIFPSVIFSGLADMAKSPGASAGAWSRFVAWLGNEFTSGQYLHEVFYVAMIYFFAYFWITVQFNPEEMSKQLKEHGSFIPGLRPGPRTAEYLETVMTRITYVGAAFLCVIAVMPTVVNRAMNIDHSITQFLGGTGLLIVVSVALDFLQRVEANLLMRNYAGFLGGGEEGGPRLKGPRG